MGGRRALAVLTLVVTGPLVSCTATPPADPEPVVAAVVATQSDGPLGDGAERIERTDAASLAAVADVLALAATPREDVACEWSTRTSVTITFTDASTDAFEVDSCGATGRDRALGLLVAEWALEED